MIACVLLLNLEVKFTDQNHQKSNKYLINVFLLQYKILLVCSICHAGDFFYLFIQNWLGRFCFKYSKIAIL